MLSEQGMRYMSLFDEVRFSGFKLSISVNLPDVSSKYSCSYKWDRKFDVSKESSP